MHCHGIRIQNSSCQIRFVTKIRPPTSVFLAEISACWQLRLHAGGAGRCLYRPLVGISERDHRYDDYLNSQECLINEEAAVFLRNYKLLMRADMGKRETSNRICIVLSSVLRIRDVYPGSLIRISPSRISDPTFSIRDPELTRTWIPNLGPHKRITVSIFNPKY